MWWRCGGLGALTILSLVLVAKANDKGLFICPKGRQIDDYNIYIYIYIYIYFRVKG